MFDREELAEVQRLADAAARDGRDASARVLAGLLTKLRTIAEAAPAGPLPLFEEVLPGLASAPDPGTASRVRRALERQEPLRIRYRANRTGEITTRRIRPFNIHFYDGQEYVEAFCELRQSDRIFALANVEEVLAEEAAPPDVESGEERA
ncbi:MAG: helix-turn-helix transcriptional regulator [Gemmatimonadota bacterium]